MSDTPVATGTITLDRDKAKEKLRRFQLADPCAWLLELVRAAVAQGATAVAVRTDADDVRVSFDGAGFRLEDMEQLYEALLARNAPLPRRHLAAALNGAMALGPRFVELTSVAGAQKVRLRMAQGQADRIDAPDDDAHGTTVWVRQPFRAGAFLEFFRARLGTQREIKALRHACRFLDLPVSVNGKRVASSRPAGDTRRVRCHGAPEGRVFAIDEHDARVPGCMVFTFGGVVFEELLHNLLPGGVCALLAADHLQRDVSLGACVRDRAWLALVDTALVAALDLCERTGDPLLANAAFRLGPAVLGAPMTVDLLATLPELRAALAKDDRPLLRRQVLLSVGGEPLSLADLRKVLGAGREVPVAARESGVKRSGDPIVLVRSSEEQALVEHYVGNRHCSGEPMLAEAERRDLGRRRLKKRAATFALPPGEILGSARANGSAARTLVALRRRGGRLRLATFTNGCHIGTHDEDCPIPGVSMALEARFALDPDATNVVRNGVLMRAVRTAFAALPDALADACKNARDRQALGERALPMLAWALDPETLWGRLAVGLGLPLVDDLAPLPVLALDGPGAHPVTHVPCLPRVDGSFASLEELRGARVAVVPPATEHCSRGDAVRAGEVLRAVIARVATLEPLDALAAREARRAALMLRPRTLRPPYPPSAAFSVGDGASGWVSFHGQREGIVLNAHVEGRPLPTVELEEPKLGGLHIVADDPHLLPDANGALAAKDARRFVRAGLLAAGALCETASGSPSASARARRLALALLHALAPTAALARAAERLRADEYLALRALSLATGERELDPLLELVHEAGARPTVVVVREIAAAAGVTLPKRGATDQDARALVLAPFGGLRALREYGDAVSLRQRVLARLPALVSLELRCTAGIVPLSTLIAEREPLRYVATTFVLPDGVEPSTRVLRLSSEEHDALRALFGPSALVDASAALREEAAQRRHQAKPVEAATLVAGIHPRVVPLLIDGAHGQLGLLPPTTLRPAASLRVLKDGRHHTRVDLSGAAPCSFAAVLEDPGMPIDPDDDEAKRRLAMLGAFCVGAANGAIYLLADELPSERPEVRARSCLLERLAHHKEHPIDVERRARLERAPLVDTIHGRWASLAQIDADARKHGSIACVAAAPPGEPPRDLVLVLPPTFHRTLLAAAVGARVEDATATWQRHVDRQEALGRYPPLPTVPGDAFALSEASVAGVRVALWLAPSTRGARVAAGMERRQVGVVDLETVLPEVEGTVVGEAVIDATFATVTLARAWPAIDVAATALAAQLLARHERGDAPAALAEWCRLLALRLAAAPDAHGKRMRTLLARLRARPLFKAPDGGLLSLDQVLATRPEHLEDELRRHGLVPTLAVDAAPRGEPALPAAPSAEERLIARVGELLTLLSLDEPTRAELARWPLLAVRRKGKRLVRFSRTHCEIDVEHQLGAAARAGDPAALDLLAAVVVGAANHHLEEVGGHHERAFLLRLIAHAATRGT